MGLLSYSHTISNYHISYTTIPSYFHTIKLLYHGRACFPLFWTFFIWARACITVLYHSMIYHASHDLRSQIAVLYFGHSEQSHPVSYNNVILSYYYTTIQSNYHTVISYYHTNILSYYQTIIPLCHTIILPNNHIIMSYFHTSKLAYYNFILSYYKLSHNLLYSHTIILLGLLRHTIILSY